MNVYIVLCRIAGRETVAKVTYWEEDAVAFIQAQGENQHNFQLIVREVE